MCGRFVSASPPEEIAEYFGATAIGDELGPNYNVAPTSDVYVVYTNGDQRRLDPFHWGLVPSFAKDLRIGNKMINARAETVATNGAFKGSFAKRRCIVPVDGFYEWAAVPGQKAKQPYFVHRPNDEPLALAGLWAEWHGDVAGERVTVRSTTIITTEANATVEPVHHRMPVILESGAWDEWLDPANHEVASLQTLLVPAPPELVVVRPVSKEVSFARNGGAHLIDEVKPETGPVQETLL